MTVKFQPNSDIRAYLHSMAGEMAKIARSNNLPTLAYIFDLAEHEASGVDGPHVAGESISPQPPSAADANRKRAY
ncbi:MAG: hypothetical protein GC182_08415 [Rhodopseudomonas sp.]|nr:hypothetical protein [Rhodopseudomonas sp.]